MLSVQDFKKYVTKEKGTEPPFSGAYWDSHDKGVYECSTCGEPLFSSEAKFDSGTGWPSFYQPIAEGNVKKVPDESFGMRRTDRGNFRESHKLDFCHQKDILHTYAPQLAERYAGVFRYKNI